MKSALLSIAQLFLMEIVPSLKSAQDRLVDGDMYVRKEISGGAGILNLLDTNTKVQVGISNFDGNRLPANVNMVLERIRIAYATDVTSSVEGPAQQTYVTKYSSVPDALANAHFIISQNGTKILELPVQRFLTNDGTQGVQGIEDAHWLDTLRHLKPQQDLQVQIEFAQGVPLPADKKHFIEVHLIGPKAELRA